MTESYETDNDTSTSIIMAPMCQCGYIFKELHYNPSTGFSPKICPECRKTIHAVHLTFPNKTSNTFDFDLDDVKL